MRCSIGANLVLFMFGVAWVGADEMSLDRPQGIAFDIKGHLYIADTGNHRVLEFDEYLRFVRQFGSGEPGDAPGQLDGPMDVAVPTHRSFVVVADSGNHRIALFLMDGSFLKAFGSEGDQPGEFNRPSNVTLDEYGNVIVTDQGNHRLQVFHPNGKLLGLLENRTGACSEEEIDALHAYYQALGRNAEQENLAEKWHRGLPGQLANPGGVFYDEKLGRLFVANGRNGRIEVFDYDSKTGTITRRDPRVGSVARGIAGIYGCGGTPDGGLLVTQANRMAIRRYLNRADLECTTRHYELVETDVYGGVKGFMDLAVSPKNGRVAVVDAGESRVIVLNRGLAVPESPRVNHVTWDGAGITYETRSPAPTQIQLRESPYPLVVDSTYAVEGFGVSETVVIDEGKSKQHSITLTSLNPGTRCYYRLFMPDLRAVPSDGWTREYAVNTLASPGRTGFVRVPVRILLVANVVDPEGLTGESYEPENTMDEAGPDSIPIPQPTSPEDIEQYYLESFREAQLFYWINSRMRYWVDIDLLVDETMYRAGGCPPDAPQWLEDLPQLKEEKSWGKVLREAGAENKLYYGEVVCQAERRWRSEKQEWFYRGSGGSTMGVKYWLDEPHGTSHFRGGSDVAWLFTHEFKHQVESQYRLSGLVREDDRMWFCHFAPRYDDPETDWIEWKWDTAADHGEHWNGIAWQLRHLTRDQYMRNYWGELRTAEDRDEDGIPDDAPELPLDEKRLGSSPEKTDTDGDGLPDMEELLASTWVRSPLVPVRKRLFVPYIRPDLLGPDSDADGIPDGQDPYPIYPYSTTIPRETIKVDGGIADWKQSQTITFRHIGLLPTGHSVDLTVRSCYNRNWLFYSLEIKTEHRGIDFLVDADADGALRGNDNIHIRIRPTGSLNKVQVRLCEAGSWPHMDEDLLRNRDILYAVRSLTDQQEIEIGLPKRPDIGLELEPGEEIGLEVLIDLPEGTRVSVFEPYTIFDSVLADY